MGLVMLVFYGGRERRIDEFCALAAPHQLVLDTVTTLTDQRCLLEFRLPPAGELTAFTGLPLELDGTDPGHASYRPDGTGTRGASVAGASSYRLLYEGAKGAPMTVVLALRCADGIVLAADSQITDTARGLSYPAQKLHPFGDSAAWGGSGARAVLLEAQDMFEGCAAAVLGADNVGRAVQERVLPLLRHHYDTFIEQVPGEDGSGATPATYVLIAGYARSNPFIIDIDPHGLIGRYEEVGFHAVGSGSAMAQQAGTLLAHFRMIDRGADVGVLAAVRVLDALRISSPSVGGPLDVFRLTADAAHALSDEEIQRVREQVRRWADLEREALDRIALEITASPDHGGPTRGL